MKYKNFETRAELLRAAADSIEMQEKAGIEPLCKEGRVLNWIAEVSIGANPKSIEFPLAVVEGKPVFEGDELYTPVDGKLTVIERFPDTIKFSNGSYELPSKCSWNPPKPKTVLVEMLVDDARLIINYGLDGRLSEACRKALKELK